MSDAGGVDRSRTSPRWPKRTARAPSVLAVTAAQDRPERPPAKTVEPSSLWPFVALVLGAIGCYATLTVHLLLDATNSDAWGLIWLLVPALFFGASAAALFVGSGMAASDRLAAVRAALFGYSPRDRSASRRRNASTQQVGRGAD